MLLILLLLYFSQGATIAVPLSLVPRDTSTPDPSSSLPPCTCPDTRSVWDIIWSCFGTIFLCAWVSVHPNIPPPDEKWWRTTLRRIQLMAWTILAPELMIYWAMRQYIGARDIMNVFQALGLKWTKTHAHFLQMGGFLIFDGGTQKGVLGITMETTSSWVAFSDMVGDGSIKLPPITEEEIKDRSKSDALARCIVLGQTGWFVLQCIARKVQGLVITELELITVALAVLNGFMYFFWWDKPFDVRMPVRVELIAEDARVPFVSTEEPSTKTSPPTVRSRIIGVFIQLLKWLNNVFKLIPPFTNLGGQVLEILTTVLFRWPMAAIRGILSSMSGVMGWYLHDLEVGKMQVPTFYSANQSPVMEMLSAAACIGILFGAIHCAGWHFIFPTHTELVIWRVCSIVVASVPVLLFFASTFNYVYLKTPFHTTRHTVMEHARDVAAIIVIIFSPIYFLAHIVLLVVAFLALRNLPDGAYAVVKWTSALPHI